ncbi:hypothetical protein BGZ60DRAFT_412320 [Tricladium varicosporioides]|nr:hypothetical protein BGZ60DRAFT_412320 [Hymenoscyphus varicosporioides]
MPSIISLGSSRSESSQQHECTGIVHGVPIHITPLRNREGFPLWWADMTIYFDSLGIDNHVRFERDIPMKDREFKALIWFLISDEIRQRHLLSFIGRDRSTNDMLRRLCQLFGRGEECKLFLPEVRTASHTDLSVSSHSGNPIPPSSSSGIRAPWS